MNQIIVVLLACISLFALFGSPSPGTEPSETPPAQVETKGQYRKISAAEAKSMMDEIDGYILLDVRTEEEFLEKRINGSILIPDYEIADRVEKELPDKDALILVYCRSGRRSANASNELCSMGYTNVYDFGGIIDWPYETVAE